MKKLLILVMLSVAIIGFSHRSKNKISRPNGYGGTNLNIPLCKNQYEREKAFEDFKKQLTLKGYTIVKSVVSDVSFNVLVRDNVGYEHWEYKEWCKF